MNNSCLLILAAALGAQPVSPSSPHPFSIHDLLAMERIAEPQVSPDGRGIVFTLRTTDLEANKGVTDLWLVGTDGSGLRRLTTQPGGGHNPRWAPDGRAILFLSSRSGSSQVWRIAADGGEARQVTHLPLDAANLIISRDVSHIAFTLDVFPDCNTPEATKKRLDEQAHRKSTGRIHDHTFVRHWDTWKDGRRSHLFVMPVSGDGKLIDVMGSMDADTPSKPFGGPEEFCFTPDGRGVVFTARNAGPKEPWSTNFDLFLAPIDGSEPPECLTPNNAAWDSHPTFSPDGKTLAYLAMSRPGYEANRFRIVLRPWPPGRTDFQSVAPSRTDFQSVPDGKTNRTDWKSVLQSPDRVLTESWDHSPSEIAWSSDGKSLYATAPNLGQHSLFAVNVATGKVRVVVCDGDVRSPSPAGPGVVYSLSSLKSPAELYCVRPDGTAARPLTRINADRVAAARMGDYEQFSFPGFHGETVHAYVVKPARFDAGAGGAGRKYPVAFVIHGGPQASLGNTFHYRWNAQAFAGAGYAAVMVDFHGSAGYGQAFTDSIRGDWGGKPLEDLQKGLAAALKRYPWMDGDRVGALGASYGGYMINWIAGAWPDRFRCLVNHDGSLDERMSYFDTEELWFPEWEHQGTPWSNPAGYERQNPVNFVGRWKTPMLVIHGAKDYRVPESQGLGTFNALQRLGIPSKLLYFPDENHWVLAPANAILWHETVIGWLDQWVKQVVERSARQR